MKEKVNEIRISYKRGIPCHDVWKNPGKKKGATSLGSPFWIRNF